MVSEPPALEVLTKDDAHYEILKLNLNGDSKLREKTGREKIVTLESVRARDQILAKKIVPMRLQCCNGVGRFCKFESAGGCVCWNCQAFTELFELAKALVGEKQ